MKCGTITMHSIIGSNRIDPSYHLSDAIWFRNLQNKLPYGNVHIKNVVEKFSLTQEEKNELNEITGQIGQLQKNNEVLIVHSLNVINKIFEGILNITSAKNADYNHLGKKNQESSLDISSITEEA